jgi:hypothetical protein
MWIIGCGVWVYQMRARENEVLLIEYCMYLTPWRKVLPERIIILQLVKKFPAFYGARICIIHFSTPS